MPANMKMKGAALPELEGAHYYDDPHASSGSLESEELVDICVEPRVVHVLPPRGQHFAEAVSEARGVRESDGLGYPRFESVGRESNESEVGKRYNDHVWASTKAMQQYRPKYCFGMCLGEVIFVIIFLGINAPFFANAESVGKLIHFLTALVLFPISKRSVLLYFLNCPWERAIKYHRWVGRWILFVALVHSVWEVVLFYTDTTYTTLSGAEVEMDDDDYVPMMDAVPIDEAMESRAATISELIEVTGWANVKKESSEMENIWGFVATGVLIMFAFQSIPFFRRGCFWVFQRTHWILFPMFALSSMLHYSAGTFLASMAVPLFLWVFDVVLQFWTSFESKVTEVEVLPGEVVRMSFEKPADFDYEAGQYVFMARPGLLGGLDWHPFTISSSPEESEITIHIRAYGRWTRKLYDDCVAGGERRPAAIRMAGPYGVLSVPVHEHRGALVLISGGIGCTPMMSIVKSLYMQGKFSNGNLSSVYFVWAVRDAAQLEWFDQDLDHIAKHCPGFQVKLFLTRPGGAAGDVRGFMVTGGDLMSDGAVREVAPATGGKGLADVEGQRDFEQPRRSSIADPESKRPDLPELFDMIHHNHINEAVGVLTCGPKQLCDEALAMCNYFNQERPAAPFLFHTETFEI